MTWELGYFYGLFTGGAAVGLIGLFVHAGYWERWTRRFAAVTHERDAETARYRELARRVERLGRDLAASKAVAAGADGARADLGEMTAARDEVRAAWAACRADRDATGVDLADARGQLGSVQFELGKCREQRDEARIERDALAADAEAGRPHGRTGACPVIDLTCVLAEQSRVVALELCGEYDTNAGAHATTRGGATAVVFSASFGWPSGPLYAFEVGGTPAAATAALLAAVRAKALRAGVTLPTAGGD